MRQYIFISDLHIGGDYALAVSDFSAELIGFLRNLAKKDKNIELIMVGDVLALWEIETLDDTLDKVNKIINDNQAIFDQFKKTGEKIDITMVVGNHDFQLLSCPEAFDILAGYNIKLEKQYFIKRKILDKNIWIEHGNQYEENSRIVDYTNPHALPLSYYTTRFRMLRVAKYAMNGKRKWLKDVESVGPQESYLPWVMSNYFYKELNPLFRYGLLPFFLLFTFSFFVLVGLLFEKFGILRTSFVSDFGKYFGLVGNVLDFVILIDIFVMGLLFLLFVSFKIIFRDIKSFLKRYGYKPGSIGFDSLNIQKKRMTIIKEGVQECIDKEKIDIYVYGHTHRPALDKYGKSIIINTGTWLKRFKKMKPWFRLLSVYYPYYNLSYFTISSKDNYVIIKYDTMEKLIDIRFTLLEKIAIFGKKFVNPNNIPKMTKIR